MVMQTRPYVPRAGGRRRLDLRRDACGHQSPSTERCRPTAVRCGGLGPADLRQPVQV